jgi:nitrite reductase/ring-hydroxylating ferredoxin subunit
MERRNVLIAAGSALIAAVAAACGSSKAVTTTTADLETTTSTRVTLPKHRRKATTTTSSTSSTTTTSSTSTSTTSPTPTTTPETTTTAPFPGWPAIARAASIPVGGTQAFTFGSGSAHAGQPGILYQPSAGTFVALDTICTHLNIVPCDLEGNKLVCPRHGSEFALATGAVINGPAVQPLARANVAVRPDGFVWFVSDA